MVMNPVTSSNEPVLVTGSAGFIGVKVVESLLAHGYANLRCFVRPSSDVQKLKKAIAAYGATKVQVMVGNLLQREDCNRATDGIAVIFHLAAGTEKTFAGCYMDSVLTTRNLLDSALSHGRLRRFVNVSSIAVYSNRDTRRGGVLNEKCEVDSAPAERFEPYVYGKVKQDELVLDYAGRHHIPYVIVRPGIVYGPGKRQIPGRVGIDTFGLFLHLGGPNILPLTYVDNCAEAIVLAGLTAGVDGEVFNIVDDDLPTSRDFLKMYKKRVERFLSLYVPYPIFYLLCFAWEKYSLWSEGQLPPAFNRRKCIAHYKGIQFSNDKLKLRLGWKPRVPFPEALERYFECMRNSRQSP